MKYMSSYLPALEALLFIHGEVVKRDTIARVLGIQENQIETIMNELKSELERNERGLTLLEQKGGYMLVTKPQFSPILEALTKEGLKEDLTPAAAETLSLIAYFGPISRAQIDYIRGVNSSFILRALLIRGLIDRSYKGNAYIYEPSIAFLKHMGITHIKDLPQYDEYQKIKERLFESENNQEELNN